MADNPVSKGGESGADSADRAAAASLWATRTGASRLAKVTEGAIRAAVKRGDLASYQAADGTILIHRDDLAAWAQTCRRR